MRLSRTLTEDQGDVRPIRLLAAAAFAILVSVLYLRRSQSIGRLAGDLSYDDVGYAIDAAVRLQTMAGTEGLSGLLRGLIENPPHSPFATLLAIGAFSIGGLSEFALYASNALILVAVAVFLAYGLKGARIQVLVLILCYILLSPIAYRAIHDFRPDIAVGFSTAVMVWFFVVGVFERKPKLVRRAGWVLGLALLIKPSFFAHTVAIALTLALFGALAHRVLRHKSGVNYGVRGFDLGTFLAIGIIVAAPYYIANWGHIFGYFWENTQGVQSTIWSFPKDLPIIDLFIATVRSTFNLIGYHLYLSAAALILCGSILWLKGARSEVTKVAVICVVAGVSLLIVTLGRHKNEFFMSTFYWLLLLASSLALVESDRQLSKKGGVWLMAWGIAALALTIWNNRTLTHWTNSPEALRGNSWNQKVIDEIKRHRDSVTDAGSRSSSPTVFVSVAGPVNADTIRWLGIRQGINLRAFDRHRSDDLALAVSAAEQSDYVVLPNEDRSDYYRWLPSASLQKSLSALLVDDKRFVPTNLIDPNQHYFVYARCVSSDPSRGVTR